MKKITLACLAALSASAMPLQLLAADAPKPQALSNPVVQVFLVIIILLAICIGLLAYVLMGAAQYKLKEHNEAKEKSSAAGTKVISLLVMLILSGSVWAADDKAIANTGAIIGGLSSTVFYGLLAVVMVELVILFALVYNLKFLLQKDPVPEPVQQEPAADRWIKLWDKFNSLRPIKEEAQIDLGHDYDGIRELDNRLPRWWLYGFYGCIVFAVIYLWRYQVAHTAPSSLDEYNIAMQKGAEEKEAYLLRSASMVDENTVKFLSSESDLSSGKAIFTSTCAACHAADGGGLVGPNLTDDYWLHGGTIKDIFKTIKYGWQEKGMKSWKDDFTPVQIAQLTSYIKSIRGKKPAAPKEAQGELFTGDVKEPKDSLQQKQAALPSNAADKKTTGE